MSLLSFLYIKLITFDICSGQNFHKLPVLSPARKPKTSFLGSFSYLLIIETQHIDPTFRAFYYNLVSLHNKYDKFLTNDL